ncbi:MAG: rhodanese-like domain-containing protein [Xanthomonadaceae bacterium]|nr:rhodanese-like domain-containing protein [Xanthomonadaceae bacterium]
MDQLLPFVQAHPLLFIALALASAALIANEVHGSVTGGKRLGALEAVRLINDRDALIVDVRPNADFKKGHLLNAVNIPLAKFGERAAEIGKDKSRPVLVYCALGSSQVEAAARLRALGHAEVYQLKGGMNGWLTASLPVTAK